VWVADSEKIRERVGWRPRFDFESGFDATAEWFRKHPETLMECGPDRSGSPLSKR